MTDRDAEKLLQTALASADFAPAITPVEEHGGILVKREDAWSRGGASGAKARALFTAAAGAAGILTAGARTSPQLERAALAARVLGIPARLHTGSGADTTETKVAVAAGAELVRHHPARLSVIRARFRQDAERLSGNGWACVPFGMEHAVYLGQVREQAMSLPRTGFVRLVVPVGSGMTLAAILCGLEAAGCRMEVLGVRVGTDPSAILDRYAPCWRHRVTLVTGPGGFRPASVTRLGDLPLDPYYEAKTLPHLRPGDLLWAVGTRTNIAVASGNQGARP